VRDIPLGAVDAASPPNRAVLQRQLADLSLPVRTAALLGEVVEERTSDDRATAALRLALRTLVEHLAHGEADPTCYQRAVARLAGFGPGLTPTGDDLLVALAAASRLFAMTGDRGTGGGASGLLARRAAEALAAAIAQIPAGLTTDVAQHLLNEGAGGRFPTPLAAFVRALGDPRVDRAVLAGLVEQLAATGAHSGADWLAGVVALARACVGERP